MKVKRLAALGLILGTGAAATGGVVGCVVGGGGLGGSGTATSTSSSSTSTSTVTATSSGTTTATSSGTTTATSGSSTSTGGGQCVDPGSPTGSSTTAGIDDCGMQPCTSASADASACSALFDCGLAACGTGGAPLCMYAATSQQHDGFVNSCTSFIGSLKSSVDPTDCVMTIMTIRNMNAAFKGYCDTGSTGG